MPEYDSAQILRAASSGDAAAWQTLVESYGRRVYGLLLKQCGDRDLAEELTQATFVKLVEKLSDFAGYEERGKFEPWLFRVAMNHLRDEMRRRKRQARPVDMSPGAGEGHYASDDSARGYARSGSGAAGSSGGFGGNYGGGSGGSSGGGSGGEDPAAVVSRAEQVERLRQAIAGLPDADRQLIELRHTAGLTFAQIAQTLDQPLGTVLARGHRTLAKLRKLLEEP